MNDERIFNGYDSIFATRLRELMNERRKTQKEIADVLGISRQAIAQYLDGSVQPNVEKLYKLAKYFYVSCDWLAGMNNIRSVDPYDIATYKDLGLSENSISILRRYHDDPFLRPFTNILNFLIEQENPAPSEPCGRCLPDEVERQIIEEHGTEKGSEIIAAENIKMSDEEKNEYEKELNDWFEQDYMPVLGKITDYLRVKLGNEQMYTISEDLIKKKDNIRKYDLSTIVEVSGNSIADEVFLSEIRSTLQKAKEKYQTNKDKYTGFDVLGNL